MAAFVVHRFLDRLASALLPFGAWLLGFVGIVAVRTMFEAASSRALTGNPVLDAATFLHYLLFYLTLLLALVLVVHLATRRPVLGLTNQALYILPVLWLAPLIDLMFTGFGGAPMAYLYQAWPTLARSLGSYFGPLVYPGVTFGIRVEVLLILVAIGWYAFTVCRSWWRAMFTALTAYFIIFIWVAWPSVIAGIAHTISSVGYIAVAGWWQESLLSSYVAQQTFFVGLPISWRLELLFNLVMSQLYYLAALALAALWLWRHDRRQFMAWLRNARGERILHYLLLMLLGWLVGAKLADSPSLDSWVDVLRLVTLALTLCCAWLQAVATNDVADVAIDAVTNPNRPLIRGELSSIDMKRYGNIFLFIALVGGVMLGWYTLLAVVTFLVAYGAYSMPPLRLKRVPVLATFLISLACLAAAVAGLSIVHHGNPLATFPHSLALLIVLGFTLGANFKDIKDVAGDARGGIPTLLTLLGEKRGKQVVGLLVAASMCLAPVILSAPRLWFTSLPAALIVYYVINHRPYREIYVFLTYFTYLIASVLVWVFR